MGQIPALLDLGIDNISLKSSTSPSNFPSGGHQLRSLSLLDCPSHLLITLVQCLTNAGLVPGLTALRWMHGEPTSDTHNAWAILASAIDPTSVRVLAYQIPLCRQGV